MLFIIAINFWQVHSGTGFAEVEQEMAERGWRHMAELSHSNASINI